MAFTQKVYQYIQDEDITKLKIVLDSGIPRVILDHLLAYAIKQVKVESVRTLLCYCADIYHPNYQSNLFNLTHYANREIRLLINSFILEKRGKKDC